MTHSVFEYLIGTQYSSPTYELYPVHILHFAGEQTVGVSRFTGHGDYSKHYLGCKAFTPLSPCCSSDFDTATQTAGLRWPAEAQALIMRNLVKILVLTGYRDKELSHSCPFWFTLLDLDLRAELTPNIGIIISLTCVRRKLLLMAQWGRVLVVAFFSLFYRLVCGQNTTGIQECFVTGLLGAWKRAAQ